ncbi:MAG: hypothetical protein IKY82_08170 [Alistipes sp.]|nr:hypothetical protein [Alistipes sp.]
MKLLYSTICVLGFTLAFALSSCVKTDDMTFEEVENIALKSWIEINRPDLLDNYQPIGGYYVELLDEGVADSMPVRHDNAWLWFDVTCRDLAGNVIMTRDSDLARMQDSYTEHTHYVPYFLFCGNDNTSMPEGTYLALRNKLKIGNDEYTVRYGTKMRLYLPSSIAAGEDGMQGDGGYQGQYTLDSNRPMIVEIDVWGHVNNPVAYEDQWIKAFAEANGGLAPEKEDDDEAAAKRRSYMRTRGEDGEETEEEVVYDNMWHPAVDSIAALYINYLYTPKQALEFNCLGADTLIYHGQTEYKRGKIYGTKTLAQINREVDSVLLERFGEGLHPADAESVDSVTNAKIWYVTRLMDGFIIDTNIPEVKEIIYDDDLSNEVATPLDFVTSTPESNSLVDAWVYSIPQMKLGAWNAILTGSSNAYGATGVAGSTSTSSSSSYNNYYDYYNYYNYYNSYYGNSYYNNYYNNYYGYGGYGGYGYGGYGGYGGYYDNYYNNYYDSYYYNNYYNNSYNYGETETTTTITTEVQPYSPMLWQLYIEAADE